MRLVKNAFGVIVFLCDEKNYYLIYYLKPDFQTELYGDWDYIPTKAQRHQSCV